MATYQKTDTLRHKVVKLILEAYHTQSAHDPLPTYKRICWQLEQEGIRTGYNRQFDPTTLYGLLYRSGYSGIAGVIQTFSRGHY